MEPSLQETALMPTLYIPHGGGPCFFMDSPREFARAWDPLAVWLRALLATLDTQPSAIVVVSAHWEAGEPTVTAGPKPPLLYDYYGFPPHTYELRYDAPGSPELATRVVSLLADSGLGAARDERRGFDHGVFIPFMLIAPEATIPIVQLSLVNGLDAEMHLAIGRALAPLRAAGVLIVGSGMSYHNMAAAFSGGTPPGAATFDRWLGSAVTAGRAEREAQLAHWENAPDARLAHPREEHLMPLLVAAGAAGEDRGTRIFNDRILGFEVSGFRFG